MKEKKDIFLADLIMIIIIIIIMIIISKERHS